MSDEDRIDRLAEALGAILADPRGARPAADPELVELFEVARDLCDLPDPAFQARLGADPETRAMTTATRTSAHATRQNLSVYLAVRPAGELIAFVERAFDAEELVRTTGSGGGMHAEVRIGDTKVMIGGG